MKLGPERTGEAIAEAAADLVRIWRRARFDAAPNSFPGALDGALEFFVARAGDALATGGTPEDAWASTVGIVRLVPGEAGERALDVEWRLLGEALAAACETLEAAPSAVDFLARAVEVARRASTSLRSSGRPPGVVVVHLRSWLEFRRTIDGP